MNPTTVWAAANLAKIGSLHVLAHERLAHAADVHPGHRVLDVGAGTGNAAIAAARRGAEVTAIDLVAGQLDLAQRRAHSEGLSLTCRVADAQELPFADDEFDVVLSTFAVMFAPDPGKAAGELVRVCRTGGRIGLAAWTPDGFVGRQMAVLARHQPRPGGTDALRWGEEDWLSRLLGRVQARTRAVDMCFTSARAAIETWRESLGPVRVTFDALPPAGQRALIGDLEEVIEEFNRAADGTVVVPAAYLEAVISM